ncbi:MAG: DNA-3-methyladenine glycosylase [Caulobacterales bacterium]
MTSIPDPLGHKALSRKDPIMRALIKKHGPCPMVHKPGVEPYHALLRSVVFQQLSGKAAETILGRVLALFPPPFPTPEQILLIDPSLLRSAGLSGNKTLAILDIARKTLDGAIPKAGEIDHLPDDEIIARLVAVRGIGKWSVEMFLMFTLGRPDVWPIDDLGVRKGYAMAYGVEMPSPKALLEIGEAWRPYRSLAAWLFWRACEDPQNIIQVKSTLKAVKTRAAPIRKKPAHKK